MATVAAISNSSAFFDGRFQHDSGAFAGQFLTGNNGHSYLVLVNPVHLIEFNYESLNTDGLIVGLTEFF